MTAEPDAEPSAAARQRKLPTEPPVPAPDEINRLPPGNYCKRVVVFLNKY